MGVPASYGGFETLANNIIEDSSSKGVEYTVFCSSTHYHEKLFTYKGATLKYINLNANGVQSILYDGLSLMKSLRGYDAVVVLGVSGGVFFPFFKLLSQTKLIVNIDGLEWKRGKWKGLAKLFLRLSEEFVLRFSDVVIADNQAIVNYISRRYQKKTVLIAYGGDHVVRELSKRSVGKILHKYRLIAKQYAISICRIEPENNCDMILDSFIGHTLPIVLIGNFANSKYGTTLKERYASYANIHLIDALYDLDTLYVLRQNSKFYIHGHSAGGTNPALVEAMFCGCNILAYDVIFNRNTTKNRAAYFSDREELSALLDSDTDNVAPMLSLASELYEWGNIACRYEALY